MLDIVFAIYEEDAIPKFEEHQRIKSDVRSAMWTNLLEKDYPYQLNQNASSEPPDALPGPHVGKLGPDEDLLPDEFAPRVSKPYFPPTDFDQFQDIGLDAPLGDTLPEDDD